MKTIARRKAEEFVKALKQSFPSPTLEEFKKNAFDQTCLKCGKTFKTMYDERKECGKCLGYVK